MRKTVVSGQGSGVSRNRPSGLLTWLKPCFYVFMLFTSLANVVHAQERLFSLEFRDEDIKNVIKVLARESGRNIIIPDTVSGKITLSLDNMTLNDALEIILKSHGFGYVSEKGVIRIVKLSDVEVAAEDLMTEVITVNYAKASDLVNQVKGVLSPKGTVTADSRTNSFIIKDVKNSIEDAKKLIARLDSMTPQVLIEARIIEASNNFSRSLGIQWGGRYSADSNSVTGGASLGISPSGNSFAVNLPANNPTSGLGLSIGSINRNLVLDIQLSAAETTGQVKIVSSPKVTTVNNKPAKVSSGVRYKVKSTIVGGAATTYQSEEVRAETSLTVTPQISADDHILLTIEASRDEPDFTRLVDGIPGVITKNANTTVLVKDGETTVIGGLYKTSNSVSEGAVPFISRIPILGWLFKSKTRADENEELLIFITPRIIRNQG